MHLDRRDLDIVLLERVRATVRADLGPAVADTVRLVKILDLMVHELSVDVLSDRLPPAEIHHTVRAKQTVTVDGTVTYDRFATWWDHYKATYRGRWWMRWRRWNVRTVKEAHPYTVTRDIRCKHHVTVDLERYRTYPHATVALPESFGAPVRAYSYGLRVGSEWTAA